MVTCTQKTARIEPSRADLTWIYMCIHWPHSSPNLELGVWLPRLGLVLLEDVAQRLHILGVPFVYLRTRRVAKRSQGSTRARWASRAREETRRVFHCGERAESVPRAVPPTVPVRKFERVVWTRRLNASVERAVRRSRLKEPFQTKPFERAACAALGSSTRGSSKGSPT